MNIIVTLSQQREFMKMCNFKCQNTKRQRRRRSVIRNVYTTDLHVIIFWRSTSFVHLKPYVFRLKKTIKSIVFKLYCTRNERSSLRLAQSNYIILREETIKSFNPHLRTGRCSYDLRLKRNKTERFMSRERAHAIRADSCITFGPARRMVSGRRKTVAFASFTGCITSSVSAADCEEEPCRNGSANVCHHVGGGCFSFRSDGEVGSKGRGRLWRWVITGRVLDKGVVLYGATEPRGVRRGRGSDPSLTWDNSGAQEGSDDNEWPTTRALWNPLAVLISICIHFTHGPDVNRYQYLVLNF